MLLTPVQTYKLPLWQVPLDTVIRGVPLRTKLLDEGISLLEIRKAHELAPQFNTPVLAMNAEIKIYISLYFQILISILP